MDERQEEFSRMDKESRGHVVVVTTSESSKSLNDQESLGERNEQKLLTTAQTLTTGLAETKLCSTRTCCLVTKSCCPGTIRHTAETSTSTNSNTKSWLAETDLPNYIKSQPSIIKLMANNSEGKLVFICCLAVKPTPESPKKSFSSHHQTKESQIDDQKRQSSTIVQSTTDIVNKCGTPDKYCQKWAGTIKMNCPTADQIDAPLPVAISDHHHLKNSQIGSLPSTPQRIDTSTSDISCHLTANNKDVPLCSPVTTTSHHYAENDQINLPSTPKQIPCNGQATTIPKSEPSPLKTCYLDDWDSCHHTDKLEKTSVLPHDLKCLKENDLLPMAYGDFTKCLTEDFCYSPTAMLTSVDDDSVVPSSPSLLLGDGGKCYSTCSDTNTDGSQEDPWEALPAHPESSDKSPAVSHEYPQSGTLNWGLAPTIIYKTPEPESKTLQGDDYMKCCISAGNIKLLTPPPANYKKLLRCSRRRLQRRDVKRRRIYFDDDECCEGLQEVPVNEVESDGDKTLDTDFTLEDPMWFEDEWENLLMDEDEEKSLSISEEGIANCYECIRNDSPLIETTSTTLSEAMEYVEEREGALDGTLESLPKFSWNEMDKPSSHEIQAILDSVRVPEEVSTEHCGEWCDEERSEGGKLQRKKRKYQKRKLTTGKQKIRTKKAEESIHDKFL